MQRLMRTLGRIDGKYYKACEDIVGKYKQDDIELEILTSPKDPFAPAGRFIVSFPKKWYPEKFYSKKIFRIALSHFLSQKASSFNGRWMKIYPPTNVFLERTNCVVGNRVELRFDYHIPANGRKILGRASKDMFRNLVGFIEKLKYPSLSEDDKKLLKLYADTIEDEEYVRKQMRGKYIAFIANDSILPREGNSRKPMKNAKLFRSPKELEVTFETKHRGTIAGMGIELGKFTIITGANYHGKSTLLDAIAHGVYNHIPGDGREFVLTSGEVFFTNKENRRVVNNVDISQFVKSVPNGTNTKRFFTLSSSGSTSQAAAISEAIEDCVDGILIDEDDSAVNMLVKSNELKKIVPEDLEPITPLIEKINTFPSIRITPILVVGALGEFLPRADTIILMKNFEPYKLNYKKSIQHTTIERPSPRKPKPMIIKKTKVIGKEDIILKGGKRITIDLRGDIHKVIVERAQIYALADAVIYAMKYMNGSRSMKKIVDLVMNDISSKGLDVIGGRYKNYSSFTRHQLFYVISHISALEMNEDE